MKETVRPSRPRARTYGAGFIRNIIPVTYRGVEWPSAKPLLVALGFNSSRARYLIRQTLRRQGWYEHDGHRIEVRLPCPATNA
jgi:hypothetical protein